MPLNRYNNNKNNTTNNNTNNNINNNNNNQKICDNILDDLSSRFVINIPQEERNDLIRICFQIELAHWYYLDFICETQQSLPKFKYKTFTSILFNHIPFLNQYISQLDDIIVKWREYKSSVPTCGAILLDKTLNYVLLVQGFGGKSWGFPKGKINENESLVNCAVREVKEETGYDCESGVKTDWFLERQICDTSVRLYIIRDVDTNYSFKPLARNEIKEIKWFNVNELPLRMHDIILNNNYANQFFTVMPFVKPLLKWIARERAIERKNKQINDEKFWAKSWDNIKFDWDSIWREIYKEK